MTYFGWKKNYRQKKINGKFLCPCKMSEILDIGPNDQNVQVANWQNAADILIATGKAERLNFPWDLETPLISM